MAEELLLDPADDELDELLNRGSNGGESDNDLASPSDPDDSDDNNDGEDKHKRGKPREVSPLFESLHGWVAATPAKTAKLDTKRVLK